VDRESSILYLKKLHILLDDLMGNTILGMKYIKSLEKSIKSLEKNQLEVENGTFKVEVENNIDNITIDISHKNGELIDTLTYDSNSTLGDKIIGKS
tara:strand:- start:658 stop:945 length:288 start_codon:yes stop_codon:yes gene_type:complete